MKQLLYIMKNDFDLIKIGISKDPKDRAKTLANSSGVPTKVLHEIKTGSPAFDVEQALHKHYKEHRKSGEWFDLCIMDDDILNIAMNIDYNLMNPPAAEVIEEAYEFEWDINWLGFSKGVIFELKDNGVTNEYTVIKQLPNVGEGDLIIGHHIRVKGGPDKEEHDLKLFTLEYHINKGNITFKTTPKPKKECPINKGDPNNPTEDVKFHINFIGCNITKVDANDVGQMSMILSMKNLSDLFDTYEEARDRLIAHSNTMIAEYSGHIDRLNGDANYHDTHGIHQKIRDNQRNTRSEIAKKGHANSDKSGRKQGTPNNKHKLDVHIDIIKKCVKDKGNRSALARELNVSRDTLHNFIKRNKLC